MLNETLNGSEYGSYQMPANFITSLTDALYNPLAAGKFSFEELRDALSTGQLYSKLWAVDKLATQTQRSYEKVVVIGAWHGLLVKWLLLQNMVLETTSVDIDPNSAILSNIVVGSPMHISQTVDAATMNETTQDLVINTSAEHMDSSWYQNVRAGTTCLIQSTDYEIAEHVNTVKTVDELLALFPMQNVIYAGTLVFPMYKRMMVIGIR